MRHNLRLLSANSSGELYMPQHGGHVTTGSLTVEHVDEIYDFTGWFCGSVVGAQRA